MQNKSNRKRKRCNLSRFDKEINQAKEKKKGIKETQILNFLKCAPAFIGCFAEDEVRLLSVQTTPAYLIVNVDDSSLPGSHWIAIGIFDSRIEIFDTLGFNIFNWSRIPCIISIPTFMNIHQSNGIKLLTSKYYIRQVYLLLKKCLLCQKALA